MTTIEVRSPADDTLVEVVRTDSPAQVGATVASARAAQRAWAALGSGGRGRWLARYRDWLLDHDQELGDLLQRETSKPAQEARTELSLGLDVLNYYREHAAKFLGEERPGPHNLLNVVRRQSVSYHPYPVVGIICPWNFPLLIALADALPALSAGAAVVLKPSELTPLTARRAVQGWQEIGAPDVFRCVTGAAPAGAAVVDHVDFVQFTGSTATGRRIAQRAAERLIPCSLELGGKDAAIVLADANLARAAHGVVFGALYNAGQACVSVERVYVEEQVHDDFVARVVEDVAAMRQGPGAEIGALANTAQVEIVERHVKDAVARGARVLTGGERSPLGGTFFQPTVLVDVDHTMEIMRDETFGPVVPIMRVADAEEAVTLANESSYGLSATVWTGDQARGRAIARRLEVGSVNINDVLVNLLCAPSPHSGWKQSGIGARLGGPNGVRKYCRTQTITEPRLPLPRELLWFPYTRTKAFVLDAALRLVTARDIRRRLTRRR